MQTEILSLEHLNLIAPKMRALGLCLSEYSFASRYLFRKEHRYEVLFNGDRIWLRGKTRDGVSYLMPTDDLRHIATEELLKSLDWANCLFPIPELWISSLDPQIFETSFNRDDSDYLYYRTKLAELPGRDLSAKRNLIKQFHAAHTARVEPYGKQHYEEALSILEAWQSGMEGKETDYSACKEGLKLYEELGLSGYMIFADEKPAAFILGEISTANLFVIHFAKAMTQFKGIYPFLFSEVASQLSSEEICCLNLEQDLGQPGLRQSKLSYQPDKIKHKYRVAKRSF